MINIAAAVGNTVVDKNGSSTRNKVTTQAASTDSTKSNKDIASTMKERSQLNKDAFFKLLITQLKHQDPLKPMENKEFISQMAQFSSLEQMQNMNTSMKQFTKIQSLSEGAALIGKTVETFEDNDGNAIKGKVSKVSYEDDKILLHLAGDNMVTLEEIKTVY